MNFPDEIHFCEICFFPPNVFSSTNHREVTKIFGNHYPEARRSLQIQEIILHEALMTSSSDYLECLKKQPRC